MDLVIAHRRVWGWRFVDQFCWRKTDNGVPGGWGNRFKNAASTWANRESYDRKYRALAARFIENFKLIKEGCPENVAHGGPAAIVPRV